MTGTTRTLYHSCKDGRSPGNEKGCRPYQKRVYMCSEWVRVRIPDTYLHWKITYGKNR